VSTRVGSPVRGEMLAGRYRLDECIAEYPRTRRTLWRGTDEVLNRQVAVELQVPGGPGAAEFLTAAITVSRIVHPVVIGVYDAVDEGDRAYVVRGWIRGASLASAVRDTPLTPERAAVVARAVAEGVAAVHAAGFAHGNINPNSVLLDADDKVTLTDLRPSDESSTRADLRAIGALLYVSLTGHWPAEIPAPQPGLPDAVRTDGKICSPRQVRAGIPAYLDALTMDLLDPSLPPPPAAELAAELRRFDVEDPAVGMVGDLREEDEEHRSPWVRTGFVVVGVVVVALLGWLIGTSGLTGGGSPGRYPVTEDPTDGGGAAGQALEIAGVDILDPAGDGAELDGAELAADGDRATAWKTDVYTRPAFGNIKPGMGVRVDLGSPQAAGRVTVHLSAPGTTVELRAGDGGEDPGTYRTVLTREDAEAEVTFEVPDGVVSRYWLVWITSMPAKGDGYGIEVQEVTLTR
jgi:hypothetical protein